MANILINAINKSKMENNSKVKEGTGLYMLTSTALAGGVMFCIAQMFGTDGAIIAGILLLIAITSANRYNTSN